MCVCVCTARAYVCLYTKRVRALVCVCVRACARGYLCTDRGNSSWKYFSCVRAGVGTTFPDELSPATDGKCAPPSYSRTHARIDIYIYTRLSPPAARYILFLPDFSSPNYYTD